MRTTKFEMSDCNGEMLYCNKYWQWGREDKDRETNGEKSELEVDGYTGPF